MAEDFEEAQGLSRGYLLSFSCGLKLSCYLNFAISILKGMVSCNAPKTSPKVGFVREGREPLVRFG